MKKVSCTKKLRNERIPKIPKSILSAKRRRQDSERNVPSHSAELWPWSKGCFLPAEES